MKSLFRSPAASSVVSSALAGARGLLALLPQVIASSCAVCGLRAKALLCAPCRQQFFQTVSTRCSCCALPLATNAPSVVVPVCGACLAAPPAFDATVVAADYQAPLDQLVLQLKFGGKLALAALFGDLLRDALLHLHATEKINPELPTCLIPVPLSARRLQQRGFNQSLEMARPLARHLGVPVLATTMERVRETRPQSELPVAERRQNIRDAFIVRAAAQSLIAGQHVGVVDDVMTTGETLHELASTLKRFGASRVTNLVFARTLPR